MSIRPGSFVLAAAALLVPQAVLACGSICALGDGSVLWLLGLGGGGYLIYRLLRKRSEAPAPPPPGSGG